MEGRIRGCQVARAGVARRGVVADAVLLAPARRVARRAAARAGAGGAHAQHRQRKPRLAEVCLPRRAGGVVRDGVHGWGRQLWCATCSTGVARVRAPGRRAAGDMRSGARSWSASARAPGDRPAGRRSWAWSRATAGRADARTALCASSARQKLRLAAAEDSAAA